MQSISEILAQELNCKQEYIENVIALLGEGNTIPFIARYRKEQHGAMDDTALRTLETRLQYLRNLAQRREEVKSSIAAQEKLTDEREVFESKELTVRIRYRSKPISCTVRRLEDGRLLVCFQVEASAIAAGQSAVFYIGRRVVGGSFIASQRGIGMYIAENN